MSPMGLDLLMYSVRLCEVLELCNEIMSRWLLANNDGVMWRYEAGFEVGSEGGSGKGLMQVRDRVLRGNMGKVLTICGT